MSLTTGAVCLALALGACGGGGTVPAKDYVRSVCTATTDWQKDIQQRSVALSQSLDPQAGPATQKQALVGLLGGLVEATNTYSDKVEKAGAPDVDGGKDAAARLLSALHQIAQAFSTAQSQATKLPTDSADAFQQAASGIGNTVNSSISNIADPFKDNTQLNTLAAQEPACKAIQG